MNEYTFKAKKLEDGEWTQGSLFSGLNNHLIIKSVNMKDKTFVGSKVDKNTICMRSENGLWEHDVVLFGKGVGVVRYGVHDGYFAFYMDWQNEFTPSEDDNMMVVGNEIDSPKLAEQMVEAIKNECSEVEG